MQIREDNRFRVHPAKLSRETKEPKSEKTNFSETSLCFPTCQVRVVRFYHSCSGSSSFFFFFSSSFSSTSSSSSSFSSTTSASTSTSTSALLTLRQSLRQLPRAVGTAGPQLPASDLSGHGWTSTATQWAPLDLNQGPSESSGHRWSSAARWTARIYARKTARIYAT